jgi:hypothetical protein
MSFGATRPDPGLGAVLGLAIGLGGLTMCITLVFHAMRAVMDVGGACADGGPYVSAGSCPGGAVPAMLQGIFGGLLFGGMAIAYGSRVGGPWAGAAPLIGWSGLFGSLGWNFLDYGILNPPPEVDGVALGWLIPGVLFELMALTPIVLAAIAVRAGFTAGATRAQTMAGPLGGPPAGGPPRRDRSEAVSPSFAAAEARAARTAGTGVAVPEAPSRAMPAGEREVLRAIAGDLGAAVDGAAALAPANPARALDAGPPGDFHEGTQALLDRLERLGDMRDRGLLTPEEFETGKSSIIAELEARS